MLERPVTRRSDEQLVSTGDCWLCRRLAGPRMGAMTKMVDRVVIFVQENHTTDNYFSSMRAWGANVVTGRPAQPNPPAHDQDHTRAALREMVACPGGGCEDAGNAYPARHRYCAAVYAWLAKTGAFLENHCSGFGTDSTRTIYWSSAAACGTLMSC
jgi:hypothetical protein